jgi:hypothetical protein
MLLISILYPYLQSAPFLAQIYGVMLVFLAFLGVQVYRSSSTKQIEPISTRTIVVGDGGNVVSMREEDELSTKIIYTIIFILR